MTKRHSQTPDTDNVHAVAGWRATLRVRPRALLFALGFLVLLDLVLRTSLPLPLPWDFRLPNRTSMGYDQLVSKMKRDPGTRIAVIGDSIIWGGNAERWDTLSAKLQKLYRSQGRDVSAYNLGMNGAHANDMLPVVAELSGKDAADLILLNIDMRFYKDPKIFRRYPELYTSAASALASVPADLMRTGASTSAKQPSEKRISGAIGRLWRLYALRDYLAAGLFGDRPGSALNHRMNRLRADLFGPPLYGKKPASSLPLADLKDAFDVPPLTADNINIRYLTAALDTARARGVPVVVFAGPVDWATLDKLGVGDRAEYEANLARLKEIVESHGAEFREYTDSVPASLIADSHHPLGEGYAKLGEAMQRDLETLVKAAEAKRQGGD